MFCLRYYPKNLPSERLRLDRCIDGPFDSSYSLAIVNRETACAQARAGYFVGVSGPEYALGRQPDWTYLSDSPENAANYGRTLK